MEPRHRQFINSVVALATNENRPLLECALKEYVVLEGKNNFLNTNDAEQLDTVGLKHRDFNPQQQKARQYLIDTDRKTWDRDYHQFNKACDGIADYIKLYGNDEVNRLCQMPDFKKAENRGALMDDYIRVNPQKLCDDRRDMFRSIMDSVRKARPEQDNLVESILSIYDITEDAVRKRTMPLRESDNHDCAVSQLKYNMAIVESFITRHGVYPWKKFRAESMNEAVDRGMKKLNRYLGKEPDENIKDSKGYIDTNKKAFNYFKDAYIKEGAWAVHFTNDKAYPKIKKDGFANGTTILDHLAYTTMYDGGRGKQGWLFALPVGCSYLKHYDLGYGDCAFLIMADGGRAKHVGEQDDELIFRDKDVIKKIPFRYDYESKKWVVEPEDGKNKAFDTIGQVVEAYQK